MEKLKLKFLFWIFMASGLLFTNHISGQVGLTPPSIVIMDEEDGKNGENDLDERQHTEMKYDVRVANLVPLSEVQPDVAYYLPEGYPRMALRYEIGNNSGVIDIEEFYFEKVENGHPLFNASGEIDLSFSTECKTGDGEPITITVTGYYSLVINDDDDDNNYPIQPYSGFSDIFSCEVFAETCGHCFQQCPVDPITQLYFSSEHEYNCHEGGGDDGGEDGGVGSGAFNGNSSSAFNTSGQLFPNVLTYPNPSQNTVQIKYSAEESSNGQLQLFDHTGKIILQQTLNSVQGINEEQIDLRELPQGIYFGQLYQNNKVLPFKVIKLD